MLRHRPSLERDIPTCFLPRRKCESCGDEQVYLSGAGTLNRGWIKAKKRVRKS